MRRQQNHKPGRRTLRFESCEDRRVLSAQPIDFYVPVSGENELIYSSGLADGWTPIDTDSRLVTIGQQDTGTGVFAGGLITRGELPVGIAYSSDLVPIRQYDAGVVGAGFTTREELTASQGLTWFDEISLDPVYTQAFATDIESAGAGIHPIDIDGTTLYGPGLNSFLYSPYPVSFDFNSISAFDLATGIAWAVPGIDYVDTLGASLYDAWNSSLNNDAVVFEDAFTPAAGYTTPGVRLPGDQFSLFDSSPTLNATAYNAWDGVIGADAITLDDAFTPSVEITKPDAQPRQFPQPADPIGAVDRGVEYGFSVPIRQPTEPVGAIDRGVEYGFTTSTADPETAADDPAETSVSASDLAHESTPTLRTPPVAMERPLERIAMATGVEPAAPGEGLIDLSALLITHPESTPNALASDHQLAASDAPARDAAFAVESWVRALPPAAATPPPSTDADLEERSVMSGPNGPIEIAPLSIDPTASRESSDESPRVSSIGPETLSSKPGLDEVGQMATPKPLERSPVYRFLATTVSVVTVGGLVRAVQDEPVRDPSRAERRRPR